MGVGRTNIHTGADLQSKAATREYKAAHERIFGSKEQPRLTHAKRAGSTECMHCGTDLVIHPASDPCNALILANGVEYKTEHPRPSFREACPELAGQPYEPCTTFDEIIQSTASFDYGAYAKEPADVFEAAYWEFDARRKGDGPWKGQPMSERDAFKTLASRLYFQQPAPADVPPELSHWREVGKVELGRQTGLTVRFDGVPPPIGTQVFIRAADEPPRNVAWVEEDGGTVSVPSAVAVGIVKPKTTPTDPNQPDDPWYLR